MRMRRSWIGAVVSCWKTGERGKVGIEATSLRQVISEEELSAVNRRNADGLSRNATTHCPGRIAPPLPHL